MWIPRRKTLDLWSFWCWNIVIQLQEVCPLPWYDHGTVRPPDISSPGEVAHKRKTTKRQLMQDRSNPVKYDVQQEMYNGLKKPLMPPELAAHHVPPLSLLASKAITKQRTLEKEFAFLQDIHMESKCPEYNGYITRLWRQAGMLPQSYTEVAFLTLIERPFTRWYHQKRNREGPDTCQRCRWGCTDLQRWPAAL